MTNNVSRTYTNEEILDAFERANGNGVEGAKLLGCAERSFYHWISQIKGDPELVNENVRLAQALQRTKDMSRIKDKSFRETARQVNAVETILSELKDVIKSNKLTSFTKKHKDSKNEKAVGVLHLSDLHFNELVELGHNRYDYDIAGQRLKLFVDRARAHFKSVGVKKVLVAFTGDLLNSDRRLDELLSMGYNRARGAFLAADILQQLLLDLNRDFNLIVAWVNGNEGRVGMEIGHVDKMATDNFDEIILRHLQLAFHGSNGIKFIESGATETVVDVANQHLLLIHGHNLGKDMSKDISKLKAKWSDRGVKIDYVIFGHIHEAYISDTFARSGSPVGDNAYSDRALNLTGRASQNYYIFYADGSRDGVKVDLQHANGEGYSTKKELHAYNVKSADKAKPEQTVFKVII